MFAKSTPRTFTSARSSAAGFTFAGWKKISSVGLTAALLVGAASCGTSVDTDSVTASTADPAGALVVDLASTNATAVSDGALWDSNIVHDISIEFDQDAYDEMIVTYETTQEKDWIQATVTIDGTSYANIGLRLKGNSSLRGVSSATADSPEELPWLIRLDKFEDDQNHQGYTDIVIRSNSTETALNEAVAVELLAEAGLASQQAVATTLQINGGDTELRLAMQNPDKVWDAENFDSEDFALYKAESTGDYSYRGDDPDSYDEVFDQEAGGEDLAPLIDFLDFINNSDDAMFASELGDRLDVDAFATYLAFQELIDNFDDIDGPGNNSYLHYDYETEMMTVVNWDLNLAFGTANVSGGGTVAGEAGGPAAGGGRQGGRPAGAPAVDPAQAGGANAGAGGAQAGVPAGGGDNVLVERFMADEDFAQLYQSALADLTETLFTNGTAESVVEQWVDVLATQDLVDSVTVSADASAVLQSIAAH